MTLGRESHLRSLTRILKYPLSTQCTHQKDLCCRHTRVVSRVIRCSLMTISSDDVIYAIALQPCLSIHSEMSKKNKPFHVLCRSRILHPSYIRLSSEGKQEWCWFLSIQMPVFAQRLNICKDIDEESVLQSRRWEAPGFKGPFMTTLLPKSLDSSLDLHCLNHSLISLLPKHPDLTLVSPIHFRGSSKDTMRGKTSRTQTPRNCSWGNKRDLLRLWEWRMMTRKDAI